MTKKNIIEYLTDHESRYYHSRGYAHNVKIHSLPLMNKQKDKLYEIIGDENLSWQLYEDTNQYIKDWQVENADLFGWSSEVKEVPTYYDDPEATRKGTKYAFKQATVKTFNFNVYFGGRSGGWLMLYFHNRPYWLNSEDLKEMEIEQLKYVYKVVKAFDKLYKDLIGFWKGFADESKIIEETYTITKTRKVFA